MGNLCMNPAEEDPPPPALPPPLPSPPPPPQLMPVPEGDLQLQQQHESDDTTVVAVNQEEASNPDQGSTGNDDFPYEFLYLSEDSPTNQAPSDGGAKLATGSDGLIAAAIFRADVLATFECPFQKPCTTDHCPFGHLLGSSLRSIPSYFCLDYLLMGQCGAQGFQDDLPRCEMGFHPTVQELINLNVFTQKLSSAVLLSDMLKPGPKMVPQPMEFEESDNLEPSSISTKHPCEICLDPIRPSGSQLAYMENCFHFFHAACLLGWRDQKRIAGAPNDLVDCPVCRIDSARILLWPCEFASEEDKKTTFQLQKECFGVIIEPESSSPVRQMPNGQF